MFIFNSRFNTLMVVLRPVRRTVIGTQVIKEEGLTVQFERGIFTTEDAEVAQLLRDKIKKSHDTNIVEITSEDARAFEYLKAGAKNVRKAVTAAEISKVNPGQAPQMVEAGTALKCPICDKLFKNQKSLNIHLVSHRPDVQISKPLAASKMAEAPAPEAKDAPVAEKPAAEEA
jgi:hypothetical protein